MEPPAVRVPSSTEWLGNSMNGRARLWASKPEPNALVVNGSSDVIIYTVNSFILQQNLPNAQLIIYPDSAHGSLYQYPELFVRHVSMFLDQEQTVVDPTSYYFRINPLFETAAGQYDWINRVIAVGIGHRFADGPVYSVFEIL